MEFTDEQKEQLTENYGLFIEKITRVQNQIGNLQAVKVKPDPENHEIDVTFGFGNHRVQFSETISVGPLHSREYTNEILEDIDKILEKADKVF